jgi:hypothetical protein
MEALKIGDVATLDFKDGKVVVEAKYASEYIGGSLALEVPLLQIVKLAAAKTDNKIDDKIVEMIEAALKA